MARELVQSLSLTVPVTAGATTAGTAVAGFDRYDKMLLIADIAALSTVTLDLYVQTSIDGGTTWYDVAHFAQVGANATARVALSVPENDSTIRAIGKDAVPALAAAAVVALPWGPQLRLVGVSGAGSNGAGTKAQTVQVLQWRNSDGR